MGRWKERAQHTEERQRKETNESGSITQTKPVRSQGKHGCPLRGGDEFNFPQWPLLKEITNFFYAETN